MENETMPVDQSQSSPAPVAAASTAKKTSPWVWILSGCLVIIILGLIGAGFFIWWGYNVAKDAIKEQAPAMQEFKENIENTNREAEKWSQEAEKLRKKAQEIQESLPAPINENSSEPMLN